MAIRLPWKNATIEQERSQLPVIIEKTRDRRELTDGKERKNHLRGFFPLLVIVTCQDKTETVVKQ